METDFIIQALTISLVLNIWFNTNAVVEYLDYFHLGTHALLVFKYMESRRKGSLLGYPAFLLTESPDSLFVKIISCPICFATWANLSTLLMGCGFVDFIFSYSLSLVFFFTLTKLKNAH
jgi:hypothetical protein